MKLRILVAVMLTAALALSSTAASAKGAQQITVTGPGLAAPIRLANSQAMISLNRVAQKADCSSTQRIVSPVDRPATSARATWLRMTGSSRKIRPRHFAKICIPSLAAAPSRTRRPGRHWEEEVGLPVAGIGVARS